jgi:N-acetyl-anhydromuramyl-L-alanine amidase AmpD
VSALATLLQRATVRTSGPWGDLEQPRFGVGVHYTGGTDRSGLQWLLFDPRCRVSYNWLILDSGTVVTVAPKHARAWHMGPCRPSAGILAATKGQGYHDANSAFYGIAIAAESGDTATPAQLAMVVQLTAALFREHQWPAEHVAFRLTDHAAEAWPRGRKVDTGAVLPLDLVRTRVVAELLKAA